MASNNRRNTHRNYGHVDAYRSNLAYDFNTLERQRETPKARPRIRTIARPKVHVRPAERVSVSAILGFAVAGVMLGLVIGSYVQLTALSDSVVSLKKELSVLQTENVTLMTAYERTFDLNTVENAAKSAGMSKPSHSQIYYIDMGAPDSASVYLTDNASAAQQFLVNIRNCVQAIAEYFA